MLSRVCRTIAEHALFAGGATKRVLVGVSGGPDSMALLACLWELAPRLELQLEVAVVDHGLRTEALQEADLVSERASALGLICHRLRVDVKAATCQTQVRGGVQEVARRLRLGALEGLAAERRLGTVALGHNADDQSETVLFRVLRGTTVAGLTGIPYWRAPFARPLLDVSRAEIALYLRRRSIHFVEDPSNADLRYTRARIRHRILPLLRQENPRVDEALRRLAASAAAGPGSALRGLEKASIPSRIAARVVEAIRSGHGTRCFDLSDSRRIVVTYGQVRVIKSVKVATTIGNEEQVPHTEVAGAGLYSAGAGALMLVREHLGPGQPAGRLTWFDGDKLSWPLTVRARQTGDRILPRLGTGSRKVADLMIDAKIPAIDRPRIPVVVGADGQLLFVDGLRPSSVGQPKSNTRRWIGFAVIKSPQSPDDVG